MHGTLMDGHQDGERLIFHRNQLIDQTALKYGQIYWPEQPIKEVKEHESAKFEVMARWVFFQVAKGLRYLHEELRIVHGDIKPDNILMGQQYAEPIIEQERHATIKLTDFSTAIQIPYDELNSFKTKFANFTPLYRSPEQFESGFYFPKPTDIWALGITLYIYLIGKPPFLKDGTKINDLGDLINQTDIEKEIKTKFESMKFSQQLIDFQINLLKKKP